MRIGTSRSKNRYRNSCEAPRAVLLLVGLVIVTAITILNPIETANSPFFVIMCHAYSLGDLNARDIAGIWRLRSTESFLPSLSSSSQRPNKKNRHCDYPMKEFTVYPKDKRKDDLETTFISDAKMEKSSTEEPDILLLFTEDGQFVQYEEQHSKARNQARFLKSNTTPSSHSSNINTINHVHGHLKGQWAIVDGKLILAKDRPDNYNNLRSETKVKDTLLSGKIIATTTTSLISLNRTIIHSSNDQNSTIQPTTNVTLNVAQDNTTDLAVNLQPQQDTSSISNHQDVHLAVKGNIKIGKFFYPQTHPNFFEQPMVNAIKTGSFELQQILGKLNTALRKGYDDDSQLIEKFRKQDLCNKTYFLTSFPLPKRKKRQRWSIKYNDYVDYIAPTEEEKAREEMEKNEPVNIKTFEVQVRK